MNGFQIIISQSIIQKGLVPLEDEIGYYVWNSS